VIDYFRELGDGIETAWQKCQYSEERFPELCATALAENSPIGKVTPTEVLTWVRTAPSILQQIDPEARFGSPPVTVYRAPRFYISVLYWIDGSTTIHQHAFSGAFQVLEGTSIHARHRFTSDRIVNPRLMLGSLEVDEVEFLRTGDIRPIPSGGAFIHAHFHLDRPTTTLVIRTDEDPSARPQWDYTPPGLAVDPFFSEGHMSRKLQVTSLLLATERHKALPAIEEIITHSDMFTSFKVLTLVRNHFAGQGTGTMFGSDIDEERFDGVLKVARTTHGSAVDLFRECLVESQRRGRLMNTRRMVEDVDQRFLLAAVLNLPRREDVMSLIERRHPGGRPSEFAADWTDAMLRTKVAGGGNVLGVHGIDDLGIRAFELMTEGRALGDVTSVVAGERSDLSVDAVRTAVEHARREFGASVFAPLVVASN
jgi:hypothetical protein